MWDTCTSYFWSKKIDRVGRAGSKKVKIWLRMGLAFIYFWPRSLLEAPNGSRTLEMDSNQSGAVGGIILGVFQGSLTHLGASRRLWGQKYIKARPILGHILTFFDPPCQPGQFFWSKIACTGVPHIVLHVSCWTQTSWGYFRPSEVRFGPKYPYTPIM